MRQSSGVRKVDWIALLAVTPGILTGCDRNSRPPAPTAEESAQLNDAENMLNAMEEGSATEGTSASGLQ